MKKKLHVGPFAAAENRVVVTISSHHLPGADQIRAGLARFVPRIGHEDQKEVVPDRFGGLHSFPSRLYAG